MIQAGDPIHARWSDAAAALGLGLFFAAGVYDPRATFKTLKRMIGAPAPRPTVWAWIFGKRGSGERRGEVLVCAQAREPDMQVVTTCVARIDPPLFLGVEHWRMPTGAFEGRSWAPERTAQVLARAPTALAALAAVRAGSICIMDGTVTIHVPGVVADAPQLGYLLDVATTAAASLHEARRGLPKTEGERAQEAAWQGFASEHGLAFDPDRLEISGTLAGGRIRVALEGEPFQAVTTVDVELPGRVGLDLSITKQRGPSILNSLMGVADLPTGDAWFDEAFVVRGNPAVRVQQMLWNPQLRRTIDELGRGARAFELTDTRMFAQYTTAMSTQLELFGLCERVSFLLGALFPGAQAQGPYR